MKIGCIFTDCASHRFIPALINGISVNKELFQNLQALMKKVMYGLLTARLRERT